MEIHVHDFFDNAVTLHNSFRVSKALGMERLIGACFVGLFGDDRRAPVSIPGAAVRGPEDFEQIIP